MADLVRRRWRRVAIDGGGAGCGAGCGAAGAGARAGAAGAGATVHARHEQIILCKSAG